MLFAFQMRCVVSDACLVPGDSMSLLLDEVCGELNGIQDWINRAEYIMHRAILTPLNNDVDEINKEISTRFLRNTDGSPITIHKYYSADTVLDNDQVATYPTEYLNKLNLSGLPPHCLELFVGCPIILLIKKLTGGLANDGTRLIITRLMAHLIEAQITTGPSKNDVIIIPRLNLTPSNPEKMPFTLQRRQFPVRPAFAMTINKSQGQTFKNVGVYLPKPVFSHGQLYVALSRLGQRDGIKIMVKMDGKR
jgi:ATP-dependent DNA helicase PIF1